ncbi:UNVERIFIED_ORG: hypothetical protein DFS12_102110 [Chitinophaga ginsengisegetis]|jgi:hypothetical protein|nr:hypothetical protein [Chitinophaga ginsengisegetis]MDR6647127.1 hypothetical protein [Chitinophaga ginsengisegetis]MDR6653476.1 hypothetical protein [Chitinophaga ginsengisegetis]
MKRKYLAKLGRTKKVDILSKKMRITLRSKQNDLRTGDDLYQRYSSIMSYYYNSEASEIRDLINAGSTGKNTK